MNNQLGVITIGQSPRPDMLTEMEPYIGSRTEIIEIGALDGLTYEEIVEMQDGKDNNLLITKLRDGRTVNVLESFIFSRVQECIYELEEKDVDMILLLCTGVFQEDFKSKKTIIYPQKLLHGLVEHLSGQSKVLIITPEEEQVDFYQEKWSKKVENISVLHGSPYSGSKELDRLVSDLDKYKDIDLIVLDCMGYRLDFKESLLERTNIPVILAKTLVSRVIGEFFIG